MKNKYPQVIVAVVHVIAFATAVWLHNGSVAFWVIIASVYATMYFDVHYTQTKRLNQLTEKAKELERRTEEALKGMGDDDTDISKIIPRLKELAENKKTNKIKITYDKNN